MDAVTDKEGTDRADIDAIKAVLMPRPEIEAKLSAMQGQVGGCPIETLGASYISGD